MKLLIIVLVLISFNTLAQTCGENLTGTFRDVVDYNGSATGWPSCGNGKKSVAAWLKIEQNNCANITLSTVYKLEDGTFCQKTGRIHNIQVSYDNADFSHGAYVISRRYSNTNYEHIYYNSYGEAVFRMSRWSKDPNFIFYFNYSPNISFYFKQEDIK
jgi:hypothetical protein